MTDSYRASDVQAPDLTKRKTVNWPERMVTMELRLTDLQADLKEIKDEARYAMVSLAESNEKFANHLEDNKRLHQRMDEQDAQTTALRGDINRLEKSLLEVQLQNKILIDFSGGVRKAGWVVVTCGGAVLWWIIQRWVEQHGR
jgi:chromosome segregation ATPase